MKRTFRKILSLLLAVTFVLGTVAFGFADVDWSEFAIKANAATSGYYTYTVDGNGNATITDVKETISGSQTIPDELGGYPVTSIGNSAFSNCRYINKITFSNDISSIGTSAFSHCDSLTDVLIPDCVIYMGAGVFFSCDNLKSVTIGNSVTSIGSESFKYCEKLTSVTIGNSVTSIGSNAFLDCVSLVSITIPDSVTTIGSNAFCNCGLTSIAISSGVTSIGKNAFNGCDSLSNFNVASENTVYSSDEYGVMFNKDKTVLIQYPAANSRTSYVISDSVNSISDYAFYDCSCLTSITIPDSVTSIGNSAFSDCSGLTSITIPEGVTSMGTSVLSYCTGLTNITISGGVTRISDSMFRDCDSLVCVTIPDGVTSIGFSAFYDCDSLTRVTLPNSLTHIDDSAFYGCFRLTSMTIPGSVISIGDGAFEGCSGLTNIKIPNSVKGIGDYVFLGCSGLTSVAIGNCVTSIGDRMFYGCFNLENVTIPDSVTRIGYRAFYNCSMLKSVVIPYGVTSIDNGAFEECQSLTSLIVDSENVAYSSDEYGVLFNKNKTLLIQYPIGNTRTSYAIPDSVTSIGKYSFMKCKNLLSIIIPDSIIMIDNMAFYYCDSPTTAYYVGSYEEWQDITINSYNDFFEKNLVYECNSERPYYHFNNVRNIWRFYIDGELIISKIYDMNNWFEPSDVSWYKHFSNIKSVRISSGVTRVEDYSFYKCENLTSVTISNDVTYIGEAAFYNCPNLDLICYLGTLEQWRNTTIDGFNNSLPTKILFECNSERPYYGSDDCGENLIWKLYTDGELVISGTGDMYDQNSWSWDEYRTIIKSVTVSDGVTSIGSKAFADFDIESVSIGKDVTEINMSAFAQCSNLTNVYYSGTVSDWNSISLGINNDSLKNSTIHFGESIIGSDYYIYNPETAELRVTKNISYNDLPSEIRNSVKIIVVEEGVTTLEDSVFANCPQLTSARLPESLEKVEDYVFDNCPELKKVCYPGTIYQWGDILVYFYNDDLKQNLIYACDSLRPYYGEYNEDDISWFLYSNGELDISGNGVMYDYGEPPYNAPWHSHSSEIKSVVIRDGVTTIGDSAFRDCTNLTSVRIPNSVTRIGDYAFENCTSLTSITIPIGVKAIWSNAFKHLTEAYYPGTLSQWENIEIYEGNACLENNIILEYDSLKPYYSKGKCGNNLTWTLYSDGELEIKGYGVMTLCFPTHWDSHLPKIKTVTIPEGVTVIDYSMFEGCNNITDVYFEGTAEEWDTIKIYGGNTALTTATLHCKGSPIVPPTTKPVEVPTTSPAVTETSTAKPEGPKTFKEGIYTCAVDENGNVTITDVRDTVSGSVTVPSTLGVYPVTAIGNFAFLNCTEITEIVLPEGIRSIGTYGFSACTALVSIKIPDSVNNIGALAFSYCENLESIVIPEGVTSINSQLFLDCKNLRSVAIPESIDTISYDAFSGCGYLTDVYYAGSEEDWKQITIYSGNNCLLNATIHYNYDFNEIPITTRPVVTEPSTTKPVEVPTTVKPTTTKPSTTKPAEITSTTKPVTTKPVVTVPSTTKPVEVPATTKPATTKPAEEPSTTKPDVENTTKPVITEPSTVPATQPTTEQKTVFEIRKPSQTEITYGDSIILHADFEGKIPDGARVIWATDNSNFKIVETTSKGETCVVAPNANGETVFIATLVDADGNVVASDTQTMTAKTGFFQKIIAFFKKIFGLTKVIPEMFKI